MAGDKVPSIISLEKPERLEELLKQDRGDDCLSCKIVGTGALWGLAGYSYISGHSQLEKQRATILASKSMFGMRSRSLGITAISATFAFLGLWRATK
ncbi:hypothetical protein B0T25DRAFT_570754 [Lasiosphaeria hispida]|uniref:Distal membrane-arm assembly complex protein 1-like domain-containing protein n=1 Tax=Lasiosphaeria hispida TaxID=260671 RepID=A0AAJ0HGH8_9PEZI|nr:hypothetical protein B0T25DRAFT_570754 [Lasiosphaeria hispida]